MAAPRRVPTERGGRQQACSWQAGQAAESLTELVLLLKSSRERMPNPTPPPIRRSLNTRANSARGDHLPATHEENALLAYTEKCIFVVRNCVSRPPKGCTGQDSGGKNHTFPSYP